MALEFPRSRWANTQKDSAVKPVSYENRAQTRSPTRERRCYVQTGNADGVMCKQCSMPWEYKYDGPAETEIKSMKASRSSDSVKYISDESGDDVEEHGDQDKLSIF